jgi:hypothetical protein
MWSIGIIIILLLNDVSRVIVYIFPFLNYSRVLTAPEQSRTSEMREFGVDSISVGRKNFASHPSLLQWSENKPSKSLQSPQKMSDQVPLPFQDEFAMAGTPTHYHSREGEKQPTVVSKNKQQEYFSLQKPYGVDPERQQSFSPQNTGNAKSLAEVLKSKGSNNNPKSLASLLQQK